jgi:hypothetical protein
LFLLDASKPTIIAKRHNLRHSGNIVEAGLVFNEEQRLAKHL